MPKLTSGEKAHKIVGMAEFYKPSIIEGISYHHYNYGEKGDQPEGIRRRIRQGVGGPNTLEVGADIIGHHHKADGGRILPGDTVDMFFGQEEWRVQVINATGPESQMIVQVGEDEVGYEIQGTCKIKLR